MVECGFVEGRIRGRSMCEHSQDDFGFIQFQVFINRNILFCIATFPPFVGMQTINVDSLQCFIKEALVHCHILYVRFEQ